MDSLVSRMFRILSHFGPSHMLFPLLLLCQPCTWVLFIQVLMQIKFPREGLHGAPHLNLVLLPSLPIALCLPFQSTCHRHHDFLRPASLLGWKHHEAEAVLIGCCIPGPSLVLATARVTQSQMRDGDQKSRSGY